MANSKFRRLTEAMSELNFINWIRSQQQSAPPGYGIGDDCAVIRSKEGWLVSTDMLMDGTHFELNKVGPKLAGRKALAVNLSDIAAMAGIPKHIFISLALPKDGGSRLGREVMTGIQELAQPFGVSISGGDTNAWKGPLVINITILGIEGPKGAVLRSGAKVGDRLLVTGPLGGSLNGHHLTFQPRVKDAQVLSDKYNLNAMIDLSDGLTKDANLIAEESNCGVVINTDRIPIHESIQNLPAEDQIARACSDGEDFELAFAVPPKTAKQILDDQPLESYIFEVGYFIQNSGIFIENSLEKQKKIDPEGFFHTFS